MDFITPYLSLDDSLPPAEVDPLHDPNGILQAIIGRSEGKLYTEDNKVKYLRMKSEGDLYSYVLNMGCAFICI